MEVCFGIQKGRRIERSEPPGDMTMSLSEQAVKPGRFNCFQLRIKECQFLKQCSTIWGCRGIVLLKSIKVREKS